MKHGYKGDEIKLIVPMAEYLAMEGKSANFTSDVYYVELYDGARWVLKTIDGGLKDLTEVIGEIAAYRISEKAKICLVPETKLYSYNGKLGSLQRFVDNAKSKDQYASILSYNIKQVEYLKLFWFIAGQWDTSYDNILINEEKIWAIDNANIANIQKVEKYGGNHFIRLFYTDLEDAGSISHPEVILGPASEVLKILIQKFGEGVPDFFKESLEALGERAYSFAYFISENRVWRDFNDGPDLPLYFMKKFNRDSLAKFSTIEWNNLFNELIAECFSCYPEALSRIQEDLNRDLKELLYEHFDEIVKGINERYELAERYLARLNVVER